MKPQFWFAIFAACFLAVVGCSGAPEPTAAANPSGTLTPEQDASAKTLGIATPNGVKQNPGMYTGDVNFAKSVVGTQQKRIGEENAAVQSISPKPH